MRRHRRVTLTRAPDAGRQARQLVATACADWRIAGVESDAEIVATELVENTLQHTTSVPQLGLLLQEGELTVAVSDDGPAARFLADTRSRHRQGLGTLLVSRLAKTWGCTRAGKGKTVWAVLPASTLTRGDHAW
ncbi:ATP-binding protein [Amycolatopsis pigmentata]|uniref:ATP-binding protein n=1 Tax=Amycolatopsis pigmentata TaxID=450801 RepID=A0ABW5G5C4_9PSEU